MPLAILIRVVNTIFDLLNIFILIRIVLSWISLPSTSVTRPIINFIYDVTEPIIRPFRNLVPPVMIGGMGFDLSVIIAFVVLNIIRTILISVIQLFM